MSRLNSIIDAMKSVHYKHDKAKKVKHVFSFSDGSKVMLYRTPPPPDKPLVYLENGQIVPKILDHDLEKLHDMISKNDKNKVKFRDSLYEKYGVSKATHRINVRDGLIEPIKK